MKWLLTRIVLPLLIVAAGGFAVVWMLAAAKPAQRESKPSKAPLVDVITVEAAEDSAVVDGHGNMEPARQTQMSPEVNGSVVWVSDQLVPGGRFEQGEPMFRIDRRPFELAIRERRSQVQQARLELQLEQSRSKVARREWALLKGREPDADADPLALRKPQTEAAEVALESAKAALQRAQLDYRRTTMRAPFNATVVSESVDEGQMVSSGNPVATLIGTDRFWARVSLPVEKLGLIRVPGLHPGVEQGSTAEVVQNLGGGKRVVRIGRVARLVGQLDAENRTAQVIIEVEQPLDPGPKALPLLPGAFVTARIHGELMDGVVRVPRKAVFEGRKVWVVREGDVLDARVLDVAWETTVAVYAEDGIEPGERVMLTQLPVAVDDMEVRPRAVEEAPKPSPERNTDSPPENIGGAAG